MNKRKILCCQFLCLLQIFIFFVEISAQIPERLKQPKTKLLILGVGHSTQLVAESYQPAVLRAFIDRVKPDAICIERSPQEFARNDYYEFTYEQQYLAVPYAREHKIPLYPVDWLPPSDDSLLAFNLADLEKPLFVRGPSGFLGFMNFADKSDLTTTLFFAESEENRSQQKQFANTAPTEVRYDFARRLYLYRTFMQAMRILRAANSNQGKTVLVIVGSLHKNDIEQILKSEQSLEIIQPSAFGQPTETEVLDFTKPDDLFAVVSFNLLGTQSKTGNVNWNWMKRVVQSLETKGSSAETIFFKVRLQVLTNQMTPQVALESYRQISQTVGENQSFTWTGVKDKSRIDSYFDPFGNLSIKQRAQLEMARENAKLTQMSAVEEIRHDLTAHLSATKAQQLAAYWEEYVLKNP